MKLDNSVSNITSLSESLQLVKELVYDKCDFNFAKPKLHTESSEYGACSFEINGKKVQYRVSKITPTKAGHFVTIWKRNDLGVTAPFDALDDLDFLVIISKCGDKLGQFIFPKNVLVEKGIMSKNGKGGKRGIRVYPPWDVAPNRQAQSTQHWQTKYFLTVSEHSLNLQSAKKLFS